MFTRQDVSSDMIRVMIADRSDVIQDMYRNMFNDFPGVEIVAQTKDMQKTLEMLSRTRPDVVMIDPSIFGRMGTGLLSIMRKLHPRVEIIGLQIFESDFNVEEAMRQAGAVSVLLKYAQPETVYEEICRCAQHRYLAHSHN